MEQQPALPYISQELQIQIDNELSRYEALAKQMDSMEENIRAKLKTFDELLNSYQNALKIIIPKMDYWSKQRKTKAQQLSEKVRMKWSNLDNAVRNNRKLTQETQIFDRLVSMRFKKAAQFQRFHAKRKVTINQKIASLLL